MEVLIEALVDTLPMVPFLLVVFAFLEWVEHRHAEVTGRVAGLTGAAGPLVGAGLGIIPQCGISAVGSALFARRAISLGTLLAVYLATSDEALPVLLADPKGVAWVAPILLTKLVVAVGAGWLTDALARSRPASPARAAGLAATRAESVPGGAACSLRHRSLLVCALDRTLRVYAFVLLTSVVLGALIATVGSTGMAAIMLRRSPFQPALAALVGLIPNCGASVAVAETFNQGGLSFGSAIAGLCAASGTGLIVLARENADRRQTARIVIALYAISAAAGTAIHLLHG
ncbi:MAG: arsenic efflux protein [Chthonomonadales bacterium]|nr:arsenic efflux protein [Chthonomonadales bacterium]